MTPAKPRKARDIQILDALDALPRTVFEGRVWRVVREGRDPTLGGPSSSRWCDGQFDILYTSLERDGAVAEIYAFLSMQPVFPSKMRWFGFELEVRTQKTLRLADLAALQALGVDIANYGDRRYARTQEIADAAQFLGFDGLLAPSARGPGANLMLFTSRLAPDDVQLTANAGDLIDWAAWRAKVAR